MKIIKRYVSICVCLLMTVFLLTACKKNETQGYLVYYINPTHDELVSKKYDVLSTDDKAMVRELFDALKEAPDEKVQKVVHDNIILNAFYIENGILNLDFSSGYNDMTNVEEAFFKAAVVKTLVQIPSVEYVHFHIAGQPATDENGIDIGLMNNHSFITENDSFDDSISKHNITLYFSDETGEKLVGEEREIVYNKNTSVEKLVIENLIHGPNEYNNKSTLPIKLKVLSTSIKDGVCYVNFDSEILSSIADVSAKVTIYSIVNSLCELPSVKRVQFMVNGSSNYTLRETFSFMEVYERNLDLVKKEE